MTSLTTHFECYQPLLNFSLLLCMWCTSSLLIGHLHTWGRLSGVAKMIFLRAHMKTWANKLNSVQLSVNVIFLQVYWCSPPQQYQFLMKPSWENEQPTPTWLMKQFDRLSSNVTGDYWGIYTSILNLHHRWVIIVDPSETLQHYLCHNLMSSSMEE